MTTAMKRYHEEHRARPGAPRKLSRKGFYDTAVLALEVRLIRNALRKHNGNVCAAGKELGIYPQRFNRLCRVRGIDPWEFRGTG